VRQSKEQYADDLHVEQTTGAFLLQTTHLREFMAMVLRFDCLAYSQYRKMEKSSPEVDEVGEFQEQIQRTKLLRKCLGRRRGGKALYSKPARSCLEKQLSRNFHIMTDTSWL
jgi:hypothetical protein